MNELAKDIEYLLLSHNCVIVPSLGTFYTQNMPARWIESEGTFLPPICHVRFDSAMVEDPSESFFAATAQVYDISIEEAENHCRKMVAEFHKTLISEGTVDFGSIGVFTLEEDAEITLSACECGVISPAFYGLDAIHATTITTSKCTSTHTHKVSEIASTASKTKETEPVIAPKQKSTPTRSSSKEDHLHYVIRIRKSVVNYAMAVAATIVLFFILKPTVVDNQPLQNAQVQPFMFLQPNMVKEESATIEATPLVAEQKEAKEEIEPSTLQNEEAKTAEPRLTEQEEVQKEVDQDNQELSSPSKIYIVLASGVSKRNADTFIENLNKQNIHATIMEGKMRRVVVNGFSSRESASQRLLDLKKIKECENAWILEQ